MNEFKRYCPHCKEEHIVSPTFDTDGTPVGFFCNRVKLLVSAESEKAIWNNEDITSWIEAFTASYIDIEALKRLSSKRLTALAKRIAYAALQTEFAKSRRLNFAFMQYYAERSARELYTMTVTGDQTEGGR